MDHNIVVFKGKEFKAVDDTCHGGSCRLCAFDKSPMLDGCGVGECCARERDDGQEAIYKPHYSAKLCAKMISKKITARLI